MQGEGGLEDGEVYIGHGLFCIFKNIQHGATALLHFFAHIGIAKDLDGDFAFILKQTIEAIPQSRPVFAIIFGEAKGGFELMV